MRKLVFDRDNVMDCKIFSTLYYGFVQGGVNLGKDKTNKPRAEVRLDARILDKLDTLAEEDVKLPIPWTLVKSGAIHFTDEEYERIDKHLDNVNWPTGASREVAKLFDMWGQAEKIPEVLRKEG